MLSVIFSAPFKNSNGRRNKITGKHVCIDITQADENSKKAENNQINLWIFETFSLTLRCA